MVMNLRGFRDRSKRSSEQDYEGGLRASIINFMKKGFLCVGTIKKREKRQSDDQEKKHPLSKDSGVQVQLVTLEEWILASPSLSVGNEGDLLVTLEQWILASPYSSVGNHQFRVSKQAQEGYLSKSRENCSMKRSSSVKFDQVENGDAENPSLSKAQTVKLKKVNFKIPEVADVFIVHTSPD